MLCITLYLTFPDISEVFRPKLLWEDTNVALLTSNPTKEINAKGEAASCLVRPEPQRLQLWGSSNGNHRRRTASPGLADFLCLGDTI